MKSRNMLVQLHNFLGAKYFGNSSILVLHAKEADIVGGF
jgi:hypothetical protein